MYHEKNLIPKLFFQCVKNKMSRQWKRLNEFRVMTSPLFITLPCFLDPNLYVRKNPSLTQFISSKLISVDCKLERFSVASKIVYSSDRV